MSRNPTAPGYANLDTFQAGLQKNDDVEMALINGIGNFTICPRCHCEKTDMPDGTLMCPHCNAVMGKCDSCKKSKPVFQKICEQCRNDAYDAVERVKKWGERRGKALTFFKQHCGDVGKCIAVFALVAMAVCMFIPLFYEVNHLVNMGERMADDVEGGVLPIATEAGRIAGYMTRNAAGALRLLETPLNITYAGLVDANEIAKKVFDAVSSPTAAFMAYNRVTGTTIVCDDGTEYSWKPLVYKDGRVINPYSGCVLHQTKLNDEHHARFFPVKPGDAIDEEHFVVVPPPKPREAVLTNRTRAAAPNIMGPEYKIIANAPGDLARAQLRTSNRTQTNQTGK